MRIVRFVFGLAAFALILASAQTVLGQVAPPGIQGGGAIAGSFVVGMGKQREPLPPYTAIRKTTRVQTLANGTTITHQSIVKEARDSSGRTYRENHMEIPAGLSGQGPEIVMYMVYDPVNRINMNWSSNSKEVNLMHMPEPREMMQRVQPPPAPQNAEAPAPPRLPSPNPNRPQPGNTQPNRPQIEKLGTQTINGVEAEGTRVTRVIPAGREGNDQPLTVTRETWMSPELRMAIKSINDDPRSGMSTMELTDIDRNEPDPALFQAPEGYTVKEHFPNQQN